MAGFRLQGPICRFLGALNIDAGTMCRWNSQPPGVVGIAQKTTAPVIDENSPPEMLVQDAKVRALLDVIAFAEGAEYDTIVHGKGSFTITDFSKHPDVLVEVTPTISSTAAGRYQFLYSTWSGLGMKDFTPNSQDVAAVKLFQRRKMLAPLFNGDIEQAIRNGNKEWASLPDSPYGQPTHSMGELKQLYDQRLTPYLSPFDVGYKQWFA